MQESIKKDVDKMLRKIIFPCLKENVFTEVKGRNAWGWHEDCIWVFNISAIGKAHSIITNWPADSIWKLTSKVVLLLIIYKLSLLKFGLSIIIIVFGVFVQFTNI